MSMFKKDEMPVDEIETIIGPSVKVEGDFVAQGNIVVEGMVSGSIKTERNLRVGPKAQIFANITVCNAVIAGEVHGNIKTSGSLEMTSTAKVLGDVKTQTLVMANGAVLHGKCAAGDVQKIKTDKPKDLLKEIYDAKIGSATGLKK